MPTTYQSLPTELKNKIFTFAIQSYLTAWYSDEPSYFNSNPISCVRRGLLLFVDLAWDSEPPKHILDIFHINHHIRSLALD